MVCIPGGYGQSEQLVLPVTFLVYSPFCLPQTVAELDQHL